MDRLKEYLTWIVLGIPGMVLIGLMLHGIFHFSLVVLVIASLIIGMIVMLFCASLCKAASDGDRFSEMKQDATKMNLYLCKKGKLGVKDEDDCDL